MKRIFGMLLVLVILGPFMMGAENESVGCTESKSASGVSRAVQQVKAQENGLTVEQENVAKRLQIDNQPGALKHLYIISPYSGQCILYSTVRGKVTSSGKRLTPTSANSSSGYGFLIDNHAGQEYHTTEVLQDDGTYGSSVDYIYWWDAKGVYHQHFFTGGQIIHVSDKPINVKSVIISIE